MEALSSLLWFLVAIGILITVHEFGHFWVARRLGVRVLRFSVGFGRPLWRWQKGPEETEYVIAAIPLGGYVKMLDEREGEVPQRLLPQAFNRQPVGSRIAVVAAGPLFNFAFAILAYWLVFVMGVEGLRPVVDKVAPDSPAAVAGLRHGDEIVAVGDSSTPTMNSVLQALLYRAIEGESTTLRVRDSQGMERNLILSLPAVGKKAGTPDLLGEIGITPLRPRLEPRIDRVVEGSPAAKAGLQGGDLVVEVDGREIADWSELVRLIHDNPGAPLRLTVERAGERITLQVIPEVVTTGEGEEGRIGAVVLLPQGLPPEYRAVQQYSVPGAVGAALRKSWEMSAMTLRMLGKMLTGQASLENISGPITIARYAGYSAASGVTQFIGFLAIISISLGVINLFPVPLLDGGHLLYYLIELVKGSPLSEQAQAVGQQIGIALLVSLMTLAFYNDIVRLLE
ncbi:MAG TPA: sigma E protease regulator RseP [Gammaproteobacteria bacterium]|nr:sigma E protease regulator RseP [Gammaproteobacteria bacterium]